MSATFESDVFAQYFAMRISGRLEPAPIVNVEGKPFPVTEFYLDDIKHIGEVFTSLTPVHHLLLWLDIGLLGA